MINRLNLLNMTYEELETFVLNNDMSKFVAKQIFAWLNQKLVDNINSMSNISTKNRDVLLQNAYIPIITLAGHKVSNIDRTEKYLFELDDGLTIETVLIKHKERKTICVSTQVGCPIKCEFCATGGDSFKRNLSMSEILNQIYFIARRLHVKNENVTNVVFMGMGEPLLNLENVVKSIRILVNPHGLNISMRKVTVSTVGIIPGIEKLLEEKMSINLAISLHAPTNEKRQVMIPVNRKYPLEDLMTVLRLYQMETKRKIMFEYLLIDGYNMSSKMGDILAELVRGIDNNINLIPYNYIEGKPYERPSDAKIRKFYDYLKNNKRLNVTLRHERGTKILGACGQLRQSIKRSDELEKK